uniref:Bicarbonate transporter-like transmembrane domain-containing protein n=1 Tax=Emiliania huxleyi TaxID=2903 RepID=A0A7S3WUJ2_EMIHU
MEAEGEKKGRRRRCSAVGKDVAADLNGRIPLYKSDWLTTDGRHCRRSGVFKIASASLFSYISSILPAIVIGNILDDQTDGQLGLPEVLISTGGMGVVWALVGGQPLCIIGVTMPVAIFTSVCYKLAEALDAPFLPWLGWVCIFSGLMHIALAIFGAVHFVNKTTAFSCEIFGFFISVTYIWDALVALLDPIITGKDLDFDGTYPPGTNDTVAYDELYKTQQRGAAFTNLALAGGTYVLCMAFHRAQRWRLFTPGVRVLLADYAAALSLGVLTALSYIPVVDDAIGDKRLDVPDDNGLNPSFDRSWPVDLSAGAEDPAAELIVESASNATAAALEEPLVLEAWQIAASILPALMLTALFFFDHNVSSKLAQDPKFHLQKPSAYHWDFSVLGLEVLLVGLFGVPPGNGLIPQAPLHTRALATVELQERASGSGHKETFHSVVETRWSNLIQSTAVLCSVFALPAIAVIPQGCLDGVFLFLGMAGFDGNELWERMWLMITQPSLRARELRFMGADTRYSRVQLYTAIQLAFVVLVFVLAKLPYIAVAFPLLIAVLIPCRIYWLPRLFTPAELDALDPPEPPPDSAREPEPMSPRAEPARPSPWPDGAAEGGGLHLGGSSTLSEAHQAL